MIFGTGRDERIKSTLLILTRFNLHVNQLAVTAVETIRSENWFIPATGIRVYKNDIRTPFMSHTLTKCDYLYAISRPIV